MHILRIDYATGQQIAFAFDDQSDAFEARTEIDTTPKGGKVCISDDHGHDAIVSTDGIVTCIVTDVEAEAAGQAKAAALVQRAMAAAGAPVDGDAPERAPRRIGMPDFAS